MEKIVLTEKQRKLITDNYGLVKSFINKTIKNNDIPPFLRDEFISDVLWKFCISALKYDESTGIKFSTYAYGGFNFGKKEILERKKNRIERNSCLHEESFENIKTQDKDNVRTDLLFDFINNSELTTREKVMMISYYYDGLTLAKLGEKYNLTKEGVRLVIKKALKRMRRTATRKKINMEDFMEK